MRCLQLQSQVWEMERFLNDYGLIWVGETRQQLEETGSVRDGEELPAGSLCRPGEAALCKQQIDFDLILENIKDLNSLVGEGSCQVEQTARGARLRRAEPLPLTLYRDGITVGHGAFRPYQHPATQQCLQDIMDGYFPSELQPRYPEGVPLQVTDRRDVVFQKPTGSFPGLGQVVGTSESSRVQETSKIPGAKGSWEQVPNEFCQPLKHRGSLGSAQGAAPQGSDGQQSSKEILVGTPGLAALERCRVKAAEEAGAAEFCRLRVRSESGEQTYELRMLLTDTIGDLRQLLAHLRGTVAVEAQGSDQSCRTQAQEANQLLPQLPVSTDSTHSALPQLPPSPLVADSGAAPLCPGLGNLCAKGLFFTATSG
ncbi:UBX domain-containing protein 11 isoform X1 [Serinus canaria]|uniref:UBX domain-containing protein 11 isoform X1 n=1 Tax=Serinus canaria TaxID=9135 RepID=UPI0021CCD53C|nr:UBX domain-containing protein 11 isoform X1 [Serinus canaria]